LVEKTPELLPRRPVGEEHMEDLLVPARLPMMLTNLTGRCAEQQEGLEKKN
jgi:hypothetical protein